jgi:hypothetical protein
MAKNKIGDLRDHLFETLEALKDPDKPMDLDRARVISEVAQTIINSAKVEVDLVKVVCASSPGSSFFEVPGEAERKPRLVAGSTGKQVIDGR